MAMERSRASRLRESGMAAFRSIRDLTGREKKYVLNEMLQVKGLLPLLMKPRNRQPWTPEDRAELKAHLRRLSNVSPYLAVAALPGSFLTLPLLAWWLDRRRKQKRPGQGVPDPRR